MNRTFKNVVHIHCNIVGFSGSMLICPVSGRQAHPQNQEMPK